MKLITRDTLLVSLAGLASFSFFLLTDPQKLPAGMLMFGLVLLIVSSCAVTWVLLTIAGRQYPGLERQKRKVLYFLAPFLVVILALQSTGQLSVRDIGVLSVLSLGLYLYFNKLKRVS